MNECVIKEESEDIYIEEFVLKNENDKNKKRDKRGILFIYLFL